MRLRRLTYAEQQAAAFIATAGVLGALAGWLYDLVRGWRDDR